MKKDLRSKLGGLGMGMPSKVLSNEDLSQMVDTSDEWIQSRTGIKQRRIVDRLKGETNSSLSAEACRQAMQMAAVNAADIDLVICCTATPDTWMPMTASRIVDALGIKRAASFDLNAACSGFLTGLHVADAMIRSGVHKNILVVGSDVFSSLLDWSDRKTCVLFGDGAGAALLQATESTDSQKDSMILESHLFTEPDRQEYLAVKGGGSRSPLNDPAQMQEFRPVISMNGSEVFKSGTRAMAEAANFVLDKAGIRASDVKWLVPHQANLRIIEMVAKMTNFPMEKVYVNVDQWGNTSAATVAIALGEMHEKGLLKRGDLILLVAFGGGYTYGAMLIRY